MSSPNPNPNLCPHCGASREGMPALQPCWRCKRLPENVPAPQIQQKRQTGSYPIPEAQPYVPPPEPESTAEMTPMLQEDKLPRWLALAGILGIILFFSMILGGTYLFLTADEGSGDELENVEANQNPPVSLQFPSSTIESPAVETTTNTDATPFIVATESVDNGATSSSATSSGTITNGATITESGPSTTPIIAIGPFAETAIALEQSATPSVTPTILPSPSLAPTITPPDFTPSTFTPIPIECRGAPATRLSLNREIEVVSRQTVRVREMPSLGGEVLLNISRGEVVTTVDGPVCADGYIWWQIRPDDGPSGWIAEGSSSQYFVEPR